MLLSGSDRFNTTLSAEEIEKSSKGVVPPNTASSTNWAVRVFLEWVKQRNRRGGELLTYWISHTLAMYCVSACSDLFLKLGEKTGCEYPPKTLYQLLCGLLRHTRSVQRDPPNFLDRKDVKFKNLHGTCDVVFRSLHESGVGATKKSAQILTKADEDKLWECGVLDSSTPKRLQNAVFSMLVKHAVYEEERNKEI